MLRYFTLAELIVQENLHISLVFGPKKKIDALRFYYSFLALKFLLIIRLYFFTFNIYNLIYDTLKFQYHSFVTFLHLKEFINVRGSTIYT